MAYRGRGRGRGFGGGGGFGYAKQEPFELFPDIELPKHDNVPVERNLIVWNSRLLNYWKSSPYYLEENVEKKSQSLDVERFSDWNKPRSSTTRDSIDQFLQLTANNFPQELVKGSRGQRKAKRVRWNTDSGLQKLDLFEKLEQKNKGDQEEKDEKEKKDGEDEDEDDDEAVGEAEEEFSDDGDYNQNIDFDDDEDDFNVDDGNDADEGIYADEV